MSQSPFKRIAIHSLRLDHVTFGFRSDQLLLDGINFDFPTHGVSFVTGPLGCGTSSLLQLITGLLHPLKGRLLMNDADFHDLRHDQALAFQLSIGYAFESGGLLNNRSIQENLLLPLQYHREISPDDADSRVERYMELFGIASSRDLRPSLVSSRIRKACVLARAFIMSPTWLVLDHPTRGLDPDTSSTLIETIRHHQQVEGLRHLIMTSDDSDFLENFEHRTIEIHRRKLGIKTEIHLRKAS